MQAETRIMKTLIGNRHFIRYIPCRNLRKDFDHIPQLHWKYGFLGLEDHFCYPEPLLISGDDNIGYIIFLWVSFDDEVKGVIL